MAGAGAFGLSWIAMAAATALASVFAGLVCLDIGGLLANGIVSGPAFATFGISGFRPGPGSTAGLKKIVSCLAAGS
jgi:hypothetical protein